MITYRSHLNRKLGTRKCYVGGNSKHSYIHCAHNTVANNARCRATCDSGSLATAAFLQQPAAIDNWFVLGATAPPVGQGLLIYEVSRSHTTTHHSR